MPLQVTFSKVAKPFNYSYIHLSRTQFGLSRQTDKKAKTNLEDLFRTINTSLCGGSWYTMQIRFVKSFHGTLLSYVWLKHNNTKRYTKVGLSPI